MRVDSLFLNGIMIMINLIHSLIMAQCIERNAISYIQRGTADDARNVCNAPSKPSLAASDSNANKQEFDTKN